MTGAVYFREFVFPSTAHCPPTGLCTGVPAPLLGVQILSMRWECSGRDEEGDLASL